MVVGEPELLWSVNAHSEPAAGALVVTTAVCAARWPPNTPQPGPVLFPSMLAGMMYGAP